MPSVFNGQDGLGHVLALIGFIIFAGLVLKNWQGSNTLLGTSGTLLVTETKQLQNP